MAEVEHGEIRQAAIEGRSVSVVNMSLLEEQDRGRYNLPSHSEVAVVFVGEDGAPPASREVVIYPRGHPLKTISSMSANLDPMVNPLFFPRDDAGSPRAFKENFEDAMAIIKKYGKPDLFITFTCNPKWRVITANLYPGQTANDRPDLVTRVFKLKLNNLLNYIFKHGLGKVVTHVHVIAFQKRGLPHVHILLHFVTDDKLETAQDTNSLICAEIPDPIINRELYDVKTCMIHGLCGILNPNSTCMKDGVCSKNYPKEFNANTVVVHNGYPRYKRRDNGLVINIKGNNVDNRWVVPYNPWLSKKYQAYINVEACMSVKAVKYLYKYIYKGHDCANILINEQINHDEVNTFLDCRYVSAPEALRRIFEYPISHMSHTIICLKVHLPENQLVYFREGAEQMALDRAAQRDTHLTAWFKLISENERAHCNSYVDIPYHYIFDDKLCKWKSWVDVRTVNGIVVETFREACVLNGLLQDDTKWQNALSEAVLIRMPKQIRQLFAIILTFCEPDNPLHLWNTYKAFMIEDFIHRSVPLIIAEQAALCQVEKIINQCGKTLADYNLLVIESDFNLDNLENFNQNVQQSIDEANRMRPLRNINQLNVCSCSAWTGIAATLLTNGSTLHGLFKLPVPILDNSTCNVTPNSIHGHFLSQVSLFLLDETSMIPKHALNAIDRLLKDVCNNNFPFGGKVILFGGDFRQILPVVKRGQPAEVVEAGIKCSLHWQWVQKFKLTENMRVYDGEREFSNWLLRLDSGTVFVKEEDPFKGCIEIPHQCLIRENDSIVEKIFGDAEQDDYAKRVILTPTNVDSLSINEEVLQRLPDEVKTY
ncbi:uncharacterized protein LOC100203419 [Hydra vulgaris]|uniref:uncharacterized protein LOC100203419 n=1 Tax=Hydra vulgaris TaxID=6087 RepID=UPI0032EA1F77